MVRCAKSTVVQYISTFVWYISRWPTTVQSRCFPQKAGKGKVNGSDDLGQMANLKLVDKQGKELVELKLQVLA